jgi:oligopeptide/dipeptide ABC transporter ATP-binding protein
MSLEAQPRTLVALVEKLAIAFPAAPDVWRTVADGIAFEVGDGESVGIVGESGSGKSLAALALLGLVPAPGQVVGGRVELAGENVRTATEARLCALRGGFVGLVGQEPGRVLNPVRTVGAQVGEAARLHLGVRGAANRARVLRLLEELGLELPERLVCGYPHQLSGGQRQRVVLAAALSADPRLLIADEPTSALDTVAQRQTIELLNRLRVARNLALLFITHELALLPGLVERVVVVYAGETVEVGVCDALFRAPLHPYTRALLAAQLPRETGSRGPLPTIAGRMPAPPEWGTGCRFAERCALADARCLAARPALVEVEPGRLVRCFRSSNREEGAS